MRGDILMIALVCMVTLGELMLVRSHSVSYEWSLYKRQHGKSYASQEEEATRFANFMASKKRIEHHNADPLQTSKLGLNHMSDWSEDELNRLNGFRVDASKLRGLMLTGSEALSRLKLDRSTNSTTLPKEVDWRKVAGRVSQVKNQGRCGSCWSFATTGLLEGQMVAQNITSKLIPLSEQDLVDCSENDNGCEGGNMMNALGDIKNMGGIENEANYPYKAEDGKCQFDKKKSVMSLIGPFMLADNSEQTIKRFVAEYGPVAVAMYVSKGFMSYKGGVWSENNCQTQKSFGLNHAVLIVGYGTDPKEGDYWIIKNSWTTKWGEKGYFRLKRGADMCGITQFPVIAII